MAPATVALFGYNSSAFTQKMRMVLKLRQIPYCRSNALRFEDLFFSRGQLRKRKGAAGKYRSKINGWPQKEDKLTRQQYVVEEQQIKKSRRRARSPEYAGGTNGLVLQHYYRSLESIRAFVVVPSMMPRPVLTSAFALTYRKIPVLAINQDVYCDTSIQLEALNTHPLLPQPSDSHPSMHPRSNTGVSTRSLARIFGSHYTDQPWYRIMTGLVPADVWRSSFGTDRGQLIGHKLDADKLEAKIPKQMANLERDMSILEPLFAENARDGEKWLLRTPTPGAADVNLYFMLKWGRNIARGVGVNDLTGGELPDMVLEGIEDLFNERRFPGIWRWYENVEEYWDGLPDMEMRRVEIGDEMGVQKVLRELNDACEVGEDIPMLPTPQLWNDKLDAKNGLIVGQQVSVAPDDTGRDNPVLGRLLKLSAEEIVIRPAELTKGQKLEGEDVRIHFPRVGFVFRPLERANKL